MVRDYHLGEWLLAPENNMATVLSFELKSELEKCGNAVAPRYSRQLGSYCNEDSLKVLWGNRAAITLQRPDVSLDCFADVLEGFLFRFSLANAPGQTRTLHDPIAALAWIEYDLAH